jgi:hypothetical protein
MEVFNIPNTDIIQWVFHTNGGVNSWQTWEKPKNVKFVAMTLIGGGGGGAGGATGGAGTNRIGGGGGGSSAISKGFFNANVLPDILYIQVGPGGPGGATNANGTAGSLSTISFEPNTTISNVLLRSGNGGAGTGTAAGVGGGAGTLFTQGNGLLGNLGFFQGTIGTAGASGTLAANGGSVTISFITTGGAAGGGASGAASFNGGNITGLGSIPTITGGVGGATNDGNSGFQTIKPSFNSFVNTPLFFTGGAGGGGFRTGGIGGAGGNGAYGCGGGGGGAATVGNGGAGGRGGDGIVIITAW